MALFAATGARFGAECLQHGEAFCFGYPVELAFRIGQQYLRYASLRTIDYLLRERAQPAPAMPAGCHADRLLRLPPEVDQLWASVRAEQQCLVRRDRRYLQWRYLDHPEAAGYELWAARSAAGLGGLLVLRADSALVPDAMTIVDWLVPAASPAAATALLAAACRRQQELGRRWLLTVLPPWSTEARLLQQHGFVATPSSQWLQRRLVHDSHLPNLTPAFLANAWWYTLGDSDLA